MPNRKSHRSKRMTPKQESPAWSNGSSGPSEVDRQELKARTRARTTSPMPSREASVDCSKVSLIGDIQDPEHVDQGQEQVSKIVRNLLQNHDRMDSGRRYCLLTTVHEATCQGHRALSKLMWNPASITDMMSDDLDVTEVVVLDHITAILYIGQWSAGEGLTQEEAQTCINHFSLYIKWRDVAVEGEFQALTLAEAWEEIWAYEAWSHKPIWGWPKAKKVSSPGFVKALMGLHGSPGEFHQRRDQCDQVPIRVALDQNNSTSGQQLLWRQMQNFPWRQDADQLGYYSEDSELDSVSVTSLSASEASITREGQTWEQEGNFDRHLNPKITLPKLNDDSSTNSLWIWLADACWHVGFGCLMSALKNEVCSEARYGSW